MERGCFYKMKLNIQLFAISKSTTFGETVDKVNNRSNLSITITFSANNSQTWFASKTLKCTCNGSTQSKNVALSKGGKVTATFTFSNIQHNDDGKKSVSWNWLIATGTSALGTLSDSGTRTLTTIPRASEITASNADIGSSTIIVINKKASSFTTTLEYQFEGESTWNTIVSKTDATTYGWTIPTSFYNKIPNKRYASVTLRATTYDGNTQIDVAKTTSINVFVNETLSKPVINSASIVDSNETSIALTGDNTRFIRYVSKPKLSWDASAKTGASIKSQKINNSDATSPCIFNWQNSFYLDVTDSRDYSTRYNYSMNIVDYFYPQIYASAEREGPTSSKVKLTVKGKFFNGTFDSAGAKQNSITVVCNYKTENASEWSQITLNPTIDSNGNFTITDLNLGEICDYRYKCEFKVTVTDLLSSDISGCTLTRGEPNHNWYSKDGINYFNVNGVLQANAFRMGHFCEGGSSNENGTYYKLCNIKFDYHRQGEFVGIKIFIGRGNNGRADQNAFIYLTMQIGWSGSLNGNAGCFWELHPGNTGFNSINCNVIVIANSNTDYDVYFYTTVGYCFPTYIIECGNQVTATHIGTASSTAPSGTKCGIDNITMINQRNYGVTNTPDGNNNLVIKQALDSTDNTPTNGVILEYGASTNWVGQLLLTDNGTDGVWYNGWNNGIRQAWKRLVDVKTYDTGWRDFTWVNSDYIGTSQNSYTLNKWRVKNDVLYILIGVGATSTINTSSEIEVAQIPIVGNPSFDSVAKRIWNGAVGGGGAYGGFALLQNSGHISVYLKPHGTSQGQTSSWYSSHFAIPLDSNYSIVT